MGKISLPLLFCQLFLAFVTSVSEAQITLVKDLYPDGSLSQIGNVTIIDEALYFNTAGYGLNSNNALIRTDGSTSGTQILENYHITSMAQFADALYYDDYSVKLLNSSGTPFNSNLTVSFDSVYITSDLLVAGDKLYFSLHDGMNSFIISYDESETVETYDVSNYYSHLYAAGDAIYFRAEKDLEYYACKIENGSIDMISKIEDYEFIYEFDFYGKIGSQVYFFPSISNNTSNYDFHTEIWQLGSGGPTTIASLPDNLAATGFTNVGTQLYFIAYDYNDYEAEPKLWKTDGTAAGTQEVDSGVETFESLFAGSTHLYYKKTNGELWSVNSGTNNKSLVASDIIEGDLVVQNDEVYFFKNGSSGPELWKSDGSASGTWLLAEGDILSTDPDEITLMGFIKDRLIFRAHSDEYGYELFKYELNYQCGAEHVVAFTPGEKTK
ncbi:hypothetical protein LVD15_14585 [Fulvivirga maritima]|uniref:hypothetical protein n=1 Tax=Fulvivirga maritima TaxID=2904247 RepID=UPI001F30B7D2|nr:hypothetical protein [Fulvivirga maritima]UII24550.1 hypothetical protein LVD15_14585 [Fulvivirga maritima]